MSQLSKELAQLLDLELAWSRVKIDLAERAFIVPPFAGPLVDFDLANWLGTRLKAVLEDTYSPNPMYVCDVPKENGLIRPGSYLSTIDKLIYAACVGACFKAIHRELSWSQGRVDFSYMLNDDLASAHWTKGRFAGWKAFDEKSLAQIARGYPFVVIADISTFYDCIDLGILLSDLRAVGAPEPAIKQLSICLNKWAQVGGRGIPQGHSPSDILAKLYLNNIDQNLRNMGYNHFRYVDDIGVFCASHVDAKKLFVDLTQLLRRRGLSLQSSKSEILPAEHAKNKIQSVTKTVNEVRRQYIDEAIESIGLGDPYIELDEADEILSESADETPIEVVREAYQKHFADGAKGFNKTLFHFLLNRLAKLEDNFAGEHALSLLEPRAEETQPILKYLAATYQMGSLEPAIVELLLSGKIVYDYQKYQIVSWLRENDTRPAPYVVDACRTMCFDVRSPRYLRTICRAFLGEHGSNADLERIAASYDTADDGERVEIICSLRRLEKGRRNALFSRIEGDGELNRTAVRWIKSLPA